MARIEPNVGSREFLPNSYQLGRLGCPTLPSSQHDTA